MTVGFMWFELDFMINTWDQSIISIVLSTLMDLGGSGGGRT